MSAWSKTKGAYAVTAASTVALPAAPRCTYREVKNLGTGTMWLMIDDDAAVGEGIELKQGEGRVWDLEKARSEDNWLGGAIHAIRGAGSDQPLAWFQVEFNT